MDRKTILLVEDNPDDQELTRLAFEKHNLPNELAIANDGVEALDYLFGGEAQAGHEPRPLPAVVLLDLKLPRIDGLEVLRRIRADPRTKVLPVVALTSSGQDEDVAASYASGVNSYIRKPVDFTQFVEAVRELGLYWLLLNIAPAPPKRDSRRSRRRSAHTTTGQPLRVLIVEDSEDDAMLLELQLRQGGYEPAARRVQDAASLVAALAEQDWDVVISDYRMPGMDGLAALKLVQEHGRDVPFILVSGVVGEEIAVAAMKAGAHDFLVKDRLSRLAPAVERELRDAEWRRQGRVAEEALRESEEQLRLALQSSDMGWWHWDFTTDVVDGDAKVRSLLGLPVDEPIGSFERVLQRTHREDCSTIQERAAELKAQPGDYEAEFRAAWPDGSFHWILAKGRSVGPSGGKPLRAMGIAMDITARKNAEEQLIAAKHSAEQAKAVAELANRAKDHFLAVLSHELRTPLTPVVMGVSMLQDRSDLDPAIRETLDMVRRNVEMEARLIDDLLDVTRISRGKIELTRSPVELCKVIQRAVEVCKPDIEARGLHFGVDLGAASPYWVHADASRLQQVFWNLLKNAIKFTPHGGCVGIRCRPHAGHVVVEVNDSGIGIERESLSRIFRAFEQAERSITQQFGGLGLGLAISKAMVELHGGSIEAHSEGRDKGATFRIQLPLTSPAGRAEEPVSAGPSKRAARPLRILLVEDHGVTAKMMQWVLTEDGHDVMTAGDVATALELAGQHAFDLLVSDLGLPDGSGHDLMRQLRQRRHKFPGIALSGYGQEEDIRHSRDAGFAAHLTKPASRERLLEAVASATAAAPGTRR